MKKTTLLEKLNFHVPHTPTQEQLQLFIKNGTADEDLIYDLQYANTHIIFAYGVKNNYITLSKEASSLINCVNYADFEIDYEDLLGEDGEQYTTQDIYDAWKMEKWIHLVP